MSYRRNLVQRDFVTNNSSCNGFAVIFQTGDAQVSLNILQDNGLTAVISCSKIRGEFYVHLVRQHSAFSSHCKIAAPCTIEDKVTLLRRRPPILFAREMSCDSMRSCWLFSLPFTQWISVRFYFRSSHYRFQWVPKSRSSLNKAGND